MVWLILAVVVISFILLTTAFRSVVIATKAAILNLLSIGAASEPAGPAETEMAAETGTAAAAPRRPSAE
jgi:hypothetical protein